MAEITSAPAASTKLRRSAPYRATTSGIAKATPKNSPWLNKAAANPTKPNAMHIAAKEARRIATQFRTCASKNECRATDLSEMLAPPLRPLAPISGASPADCETGRWKLEVAPRREERLATTATAPSVRLGSQPKPWVGVAERRDQELASQAASYPRDARNVDGVGGIHHFGVDQVICPSPSHDLAVALEHVTYPIGLRPIKDDNGQCSASLVRVDGRSIPTSRSPSAVADYDPRREDPCIAALQWVVYPTVETGHAPRELDAHSVTLTHCHTTLQIRRSRARTLFVCAKQERPPHQQCRPKINRGQQSEPTIKEATLAADRRPWIRPPEDLST